MPKLARLILKPNRERRLENFHPWVFKDDLQALEGSPQPGEVGEVLAANGAFVGMAYLNPQASIPARILARERRSIDLAFYRQQLRQAITRRKGIEDTNAMRLCNAESDGLPGLIVDRFDGVLSVQLRNAGLERHRELVCKALQLETAALAAFERSDTSERSKEGLQAHVGSLWGTLPEEVEFLEGNIRLRFSPFAGQKTGFYLDQRDNRRWISRALDSSSKFLDVYSYTGGFSLQAAAKGASALAVDKDPVALATLESVARLNGLDARIGVRLGDALEVLDQLVREGRRFTHAVVDPPTLAKRKDEVVAAKRIFTIACKNVLRMLEPGGQLMVSTCAFHIKLEDLIEALRFAGADAGRRLEVLGVSFQPADHPWIVQVPESLYLKTLLLKAD